MVTSQGNKLSVERDQLISYQERLDEAIELATEGEISEVDLAELEADLDSMIPLAVRREMPPIENADAAPDLSEEFTTRMSATSDSALDVQITPTILMPLQ